jgi:predicted DNA-binding transcriptional regulator AlpA
MAARKLADDLCYPPKAMRASRAAAYLGMSQSAFLRLVEEKLMPEPVKIKGMTTWDRLELDAAYDNFKSAETEPINTMHKILGIKP